MHKGYKELHRYWSSFAFKTVGSKEATVKPTGMYLRRVLKVNDDQYLCSNKKTPVIEK